MNIAVITGSGGLLGGECVKVFSDKFDLIIGIDNNLRSFFFGKSGATDARVELLKTQFTNYHHYDCDICSRKDMEQIFSEYNTDIKLIIHAAAQPSHDWAATNIQRDFEVNALGTLNLLQCFKTHCLKACFVFSSSSKVYGTHVNNLPLVELDTRYELPGEHFFYPGVSEQMSVDHTMHSFFGASKLAADIYVQEYKTYFSLNTVVFRPGCITGANHAAVEAHGFLNYLVKCAVNKTVYNVYGYGGKQVRDNIHAHDLANAFLHYYKNPTREQVYNLGGGRKNNVSILEAIELIREITGHRINTSPPAAARLGDHQWYITNNEKFSSDFPLWKQDYDIQAMITEIAQRYTN